MPTLISTSPVLSGLKYEEWIELEEISLSFFLQGDGITSTACFLLKCKVELNNCLDPMLELQCLLGSMEFDRLK